MKDAVIKIYNASAGSGKTFALTKEYLSKIIKSGNPGFFKYILAITFTNKAVNEMKNRIVQNLFDFADEAVFEKDNTMFQLISKETGLSPKEVQQRAKNAVVFLLSSYSYFDVETIDKFNHRLIRTFARDLKLPANFKVELDTEGLVQEAADRVIAKVGKEKLLTEVVINFMIEKTAEDKSWDVSRDLYEIAKLLVLENQLPHIKKLEGKTIEDFVALKKLLLKKIADDKNKVREIAEKFFEITRQNGLDETHFSGKRIYNYFQKLEADDYKINFDGVGWQNFNPPIYPARVSPSEGLTLDRLTPVFKDLFDKSKNLIQQTNLHYILLTNINSLTLLNSIREEFILIQNEQNLLPISEFNSIISNEIKNQPAPFIYERLGEKYRHFLIDEFQDTSQMQWKNLVPLIDNSISQAEQDSIGGSLFLVGDAKQSVYRWRGGFPEQFIKLYKKETDFSVSEILVEQLDTNYRSSQEVISYNNRFFSFLSSTFLDETHQQLYREGNDQKFNNAFSGYVSVAFIEGKNKDVKDENYPPAVLDTIQNVLQHGYALEEIAILVRKNDMGVQIAAHLSENGIQVSSSEALILANSPQIQTVINVLRLTVNFNDQKAKADLLGYIYDFVESDIERHLFIKNNLNTSLQQFEAALKLWDIFFGFENAQSIPLYELCEEIIQKFVFGNLSTAHIQSFLEIVLEFTQNHRGIANDFLEYWQKNENAGVNSSGESEGVKIMSVHKSKGLEFPVVIYPYAEDELEFNKSTVWFSLDREEYCGFDEMLIPLSKTSMAKIGELGYAVYDENYRKLQLDVINVVYVAQTRASEQLYIISNYSKVTRSNNTAALYKSFLESINRWEDSVRQYGFGSPERTFLPKKKTTHTLSQTGKFYPKPAHLQIQIATHNNLLWDTALGEAIEKGNLLHQALSKILDRDLAEQAIKQMTFEGVIDKRQEKILLNEVTQIINHPLLEKYFESGVNAVTEQEIFLDSGEVIRPDRINFLSEKKAAVIDYKTGSAQEKYHNQIERYARALENLGFDVQEKLLVYISGQIVVERV